MPTRDFAPTLIDRFQKQYPLAETEMRAVERLPVKSVLVPRHGFLVREGDHPSHCQMIIEGIAGTTQTLENGRRQISAFHMRQDFPDLLSLHLEIMDCDIVALTDCRVGMVEHGAVKSLCHENPRLADSFWRMTLVEAAIYRQWVTNVGQRPAEQRLAHLLAETITRLELVGVGSRNSCPFPLTQGDLSEATGMSLVHVNRSIQSLRSRGLIELERGLLIVADRPALEKFAAFDATYLHVPERDI